MFDGLARRGGATGLIPRLAEKSKKDRQTCRGTGEFEVVGLKKCGIKREKVKTQDTIMPSAR
jgi:hypothetical protein